MVSRVEEFTLCRPTAVLNAMKRNLRAVCCLDISCPLPYKYVYVVSCFHIVKRSLCFWCKLVKSKFAHMGRIPGNCFTLCQCSLSSHKQWTRICCYVAQWCYLCFYHSNFVTILEIFRRIYSFPCSLSNILFTTASSYFSETCCRGESPNDQAEIFICARASSDCAARQEYQCGWPPIGPHCLLHP